MFVVVKVFVTLFLVLTGAAARRDKTSHTLNVFSGRVFFWSRGIVDGFFGVQSVWNAVQGTVRRRRNVIRRGQRDRINAENRNRALKKRNFSPNPDFPP